MPALIVNHDFHEQALGGCDVRHHDGTFWSRFWFYVFLPTVRCDKSCQPKEKP